MYLKYKEQLAEFFIQGCKNPGEERIGAEYEKFVFSNESRHRASYKGDQGIGALLKRLEQQGWTGIYENEVIIGLQKEGQVVSLEPGGQLEFSTPPLKTLHDIKAQSDTHLITLKPILKDLGLSLVSCGVDPVTSQGEIPWMPKQRYEIMRHYMPKQGNLGLDMMTRTCTVQANLDYFSEEDMVQKMRVAMALQPLIAAIFANSPFVDGKRAGSQRPSQGEEYLGYRMHIWQNTDPDRSGLLPFVFEEGMGFSTYVDYMLQVPMYFVYRGRYIDMAGKSFHDFMKGQLPGLSGEYPTLQDWQDHSSTAFPQVRLKQYLEMRAADAGPLPYLEALPALWAGIFYDAESLSKASFLIKQWSIQELQEVYRQVPQKGLAACLARRPLQEIAIEIIEIAIQGLQRRGFKNDHGKDESIYLEPLQEKITQGRVPAKEWIEAYEKNPLNLLKLVIV